MDHASQAFRPPDPAPHRSLSAATVPVVSVPVPVAAGPEGGALELAAGSPAGSPKELASVDGWVEVQRYLRLLGGTESAWEEVGEK